MKIAEGHDVRLGICDVDKILSKSQLFVVY